MKPEYIIIHHSLTKDSGTVSWGAIREYHTRALGWRDIGYHFGIEFIGNRYETLLGRLWNQEGAHTVGMNARSIGICVVGNFDIDPATDALKQVLGPLLEAVRDAFNIPGANVKGHCEYAPKTCPGRNLFEWVRQIRA